MTTAFRVVLLVCAYVILAAGCESQAAKRQREEEQDKNRIDAAFRAFAAANGASIEWAESEFYPYALNLQQKVLLDGKPIALRGSVYDVYSKEDVVWARIGLDSEHADIAKLRVEPDAVDRLVRETWNEETDWLLLASAQIEQVKVCREDEFGTGITLVGKMVEFEVIPAYLP